MSQLPTCSPRRSFQTAPRPLTSREEARWSSRVVELGQSVTFVSIGIGVAGLMGHVCIYTCIYKPVVIRLSKRTISIVFCCNSAEFPIFSWAIWRRIHGDSLHLARVSY